jgi:hypothetical protein
MISREAAITKHSDSYSARLTHSTSESAGSKTTQQKTWTAGRGARDVPARDILIIKLVAFGFKRLVWRKRESYKVLRILDTCDVKLALRNPLPLLPTLVFESKATTRYSRSMSRDWFIHNFDGNIKSVHWSGTTGRRTYQGRE